MPERELKYWRKIALVTEKISDLPKKIDSDLAKDATLFRIQIAIEATIDISAMLVKDHGREVSDDYHNIEMLADLKVISTALSEEIKKLNGLRNAIVHKYNKFEEKHVFEHKEKIVKTLQKFLSAVENDIKTLFGKNKS